MGLHGGKFAIEADCIVPGSMVDYAEITRLWKKSVLATHDFLSAEYLVRLEELMPSLYLPAVKELWLYRKDGVFAGFCGCSDSFVEMLFVHPGFLRQGIGRTLLKHLERMHGPLRVDVNEANKNALKFYLASGFSITGFSPLDDQGQPYPLLHLAQQG